MRRFSVVELEKFLQCPKCGGELTSKDSSIACTACGKKITSFHGRPVLIKDDNELFPPSAYIDPQASPETPIKRRGRFQRLKEIIPSQSVNVARERIYRQISMERNLGDNIILVVGCGNQTAQLQKHFSTHNTIFVFCDIDKNADVDIFCDAHDLPFKDNLFSGVITTAVLECVMYPEKVVAQIHRVLKQNGFVYSEIPFLQSVKEGAYDFTRFSITGHRRLFE